VLLIQSHKALRHEVEAETPSITTLATILILAFWTRWEEGLQFGKAHIIGAMAFLRNALSQYGALSLLPDFSYYLFAFLYDTYYRLDSLSCLVRSALKTDQSRTMSLPPFDEVCPAYFVLGQDEKPRVDPWMSYVRGLYPLIKRAADLCDRVNSNSTPIITDAESLKFEIETWRPYRTILIKPNGYSISPELKDDIENMGEAYRYVTLLYLHQVVPEIFRNRTHELAQRIFDHLKKIRSTSRVTIVQHYPLLVAGCEACSVDDRAWVKERWMALMASMNMTNIDNCLKITQEVWKRRDIYRERQKLGIQPGFGDIGDTDGKLDPEFTFQGYFHWASAMKYLKFQVAL
jgi:Fungal specific transcription factor domain